MKNREKFKEVFGIDVRWSNALHPQIEALSSITLKGVSCAGEWLESEYKEQSTTNAIPIQDKIKEILDGYDGSMPSMITQFNEIQKLIKSEDKK